MPYIEQRYRDMLDPEIDELIGGLIRFDQGSTVPDGAINYVFTKILLAFFGPFGENNRAVTYYNIQRVNGLLTCIKDEYNRRVTVPYEDKKIEQNGDVY